MLKTDLSDIFKTVPAKYHTIRDEKKENFFDANKASLRFFEATSPVYDQIKT